jgi:hypothetical protein
MNDSKKVGLFQYIPSTAHANHSDRNTRGLNPFQESGSAGRRCYLIKKLIKNLTLPA